MRGFGRRGNRDLHVISHRKSSSKEKWSNTKASIPIPGCSGEGLADTEVESVEVASKGSSQEETKGLKAILQEREGEMEKIGERRKMLEGEIRTLRGALQLIA